MGSVHKSRVDIVVCMCVQLNKCCVVCVSALHMRQYGEVCVFALNLCKYDLRKGDLFVLRWARVRRVCLGSVSSVVFIGGGVYYFIFSFYEVFYDYGGVYCCEVGVYVLFYHNK